jgi:hypothetical protein
MNRFLLQAAFGLTLCPLLVAQQPQQAATPSTTEQLTLVTQQAAEAPQGSADIADSDHKLSLKNARTIFICSQTDFLTVSTMERALMKQKNWEKLGLSIISDPRGADLEIQVDRLIFTHIHTYVLSDKRTGIILASDRVRAIDGVVAAGPMAEQIVKILSAVRLQSPAQKGDQGL